MKRFNFKGRKIICLLLASSIATQSLAAFSWPQLISLFTKKPATQKLSAMKKLNNTVFSKKTLFGLGLVVSVGIAALIFWTKLGKKPVAGTPVVDEEPSAETPLVDTQEVVRTESELIFDAINKNNKDIVTLLLASGAKEFINKADNDGRTPLLWACFKNKDIVTLLLDKGAQESINKACIFGNTPLLFACSNNIDIVTLLLESGAQESINKANNNGWTPLLWACRENNLDIVTLLLANGAQESVNKANKYGLTPLHRACEKNNIDIVKLLLDNGANIDQISLNEAANKPEILELLTLVQGYDKNIKTGEYFELPKGKENDEKLLAFVDFLNKTRKGIISKKLRPHLYSYDEEKRESAKKKFGNTTIRFAE